MYEAQGYSPLLGRWGVLCLRKTERECADYIRRRVNPNWRTRIVKINPVW